MAVNLQEHVEALRRKARPMPANSLLPRVFIAKTLQPVGPIPADVEVIVEVNVAGKFQLTWYDPTRPDRPVWGGPVAPDAGLVDVSEIEAARRRELFDAISTEHLEAELSERRQKLRDAEKAKKEGAK